MVRIWASSRVGKADRRVDKGIVNNGEEGMGRSIRGGMMVTFLCVVVQRGCRQLKVGRGSSKVGDTFLVVD